MFLNAITKIQNETNSEDGHLVFLIFKIKQECIDRDSNISSLFQLSLSMHSCFILNIKNTRCLFSEFVSFCKVIQLV